jgi:hypothetical protein
MGQFLIASGWVHLFRFVTPGHHQNCDLATRARCHSAARKILAKSGPFMQCTPHLDNSEYGVFWWNSFSKGQLISE